MFQVQKDKVKILCSDYDLWKYLIVNCISLLFEKWLFFWQLFKIFL